MRERVKKGRYGDRGRKGENEKENVFQRLVHTCTCIGPWPSPALFNWKSASLEELRTVQYQENKKYMKEELKVKIKKNLEKEWKIFDNKEENQYWWILKPSVLGKVTY